MSLTATHTDDVRGEKFTAQVLHYVDSGVDFYAVDGGTFVFVVNPTAAFGEVPKWNAGFARLGDAIL